ncbi:hypothetical protein VPMS16_1325 [Vibrio sp. 16]|nr:hypothetical protein VPMS16_1325 [Vibrio sp. 16]
MALLSNQPYDPSDSVTCNLGARMMIAAIKAIITMGALDLVPCDSPTTL